MKLNVTIEIWQKGDWFLAKAPELDFVSQGKTLEEAKENLFEVIRIQFQEMEEMGTLEEYLAECGFEIEKDQILPRKEGDGSFSSGVNFTLFERSGKSPHPVLPGF